LGGAFDVAAAYTSYMETEGAGSDLFRNGDAGFA
jgi:hypothetical protein